MSHVAGDNITRAPHLVVCVSLFLDNLPCSYGQLLSSEPLRVNFHPSSLLSIGDLLAYVRDLCSAAAASDSTALTVAQPGLQPAPQASVRLADEQLPHGLERLGSGAGGPQHVTCQLQQAHGQEQLHVAPLMQPLRALACAEAPPSIEEQMAVTDGLTSRIPQRWVA